MVRWNASKTLMKDYLLYSYLICRLKSYFLGHSILWQSITYSILKMGLAEGELAIDMENKWKSNIKAKSFLILTGIQLKHSVILRNGIMR